MHIVVTGGTGFVGRALAAKLITGGHRVTALSRRMPTADRLPPGFEINRWDPSQPSADLFSGADAVVNLAGESIAAGRWTAAQKERIMTSRVNTTRALVYALQQCPNRPRVLVSASAVGYYGPRQDEELDEHAPAGNDFLGRVGAAWETEARAAEAADMRVVITRLGLILGEGGGLLAKMVPAFSLGLGGPAGNGRQWMSWVHLDDVINALVFVLENEATVGPVNVTSPHPVRNSEFCQTLGRVLGRPAKLPVPAAALRLAMGEMADMLLTGQRVLPIRLKSLGFEHRFPFLEDALRDVLGKEFRSQESGVRIKRKD